MNKDFSYQKIEELVDIGLGFTHTPSYTTSGIPFLSVKNITNGEISFNSTKFISKEDFEKAPNGAKPQKGDVLFGRVGTIGYPHVIETDISFCTFVSLGYMRIKDSNILCNYYLKYWMKSDLFYSQVLSNIQGIAIKNLNTGWLKNFIIPTPPLPIQEQIVKELDILSDIITKKKEQLAELDKLAQATFYDMFGDPVENEKNWELKKLDEICTKITDGTHTSPKFLEKGIPFLFVSNIQNNELNFNTQKYISTEEYERLTRNTKIEQWDLLYTSVGSFGNPAIIKTNEKFCFQRHIAHLKPKHKIINIIFFHAVMKIDYVKHQANRLAIGVAQKTLNLSAIKKIVIPNPPISLQNQFAEKIEAIEKQKALINQSITDTQLLFDYTMDKYFN